MEELDIEEDYKLQSNLAINDQSERLKELKFSSNFINSLKLKR